MMAVLMQNAQTCKFLTDAFEGKRYGEYTEPICRVVLPSGGDKTCRSLQEFDTLTAYYMQ